MHWRLIMTTCRLSFHCFLYWPMDLIGSSRRKPLDGSAVSGIAQNRPMDHSGRYSFPLADGLHQNAACCSILMGTWLIETLPKAMSEHAMHLKPEKVHLFIRSAWLGLGFQTSKLVNPPPVSVLHDPSVAERTMWIADTRFVLWCVERKHIVTHCLAGRSFGHRQDAGCTRFQCQHTVSGWCSFYQQQT